MAKDNFCVGGRKLGLGRTMPGFSRPPVLFAWVLAAYGAASACRPGPVHADCQAIETQRTQRTSGGARRQLPADRARGAGPIRPIWLILLIPHPGRPLIAALTHPCLKATGLPDSLWGLWPLGAWGPLGEGSHWVSLGAASTAAVHNKDPGHLSFEQ